MEVPEGPRRAVNQNLVTILTGIGAVVALGTFMSLEHSRLDARLIRIETELFELNQRIAYIDGHLFGLDRPQEE